MSSSSVGPLGQASQGILGDGYLLLKAKQGKLSGALGSVSGHQPSGAFQTGVCGEGGCSRQGGEKQEGGEERAFKSRGEKSKWKEKGREGKAEPGEGRGDGDEVAPRTSHGAPGGILHSRRGTWRGGVGAAGGTERGEGRSRGEKQRGESSAPRPGGFTDALGGGVKEVGRGPAPTCAPSASQPRGASRSRPARPLGCLPPTVCSWLSIQWWNVSTISFLRLKLRPTVSAGMKYYCCTLAFVSGL